MITMLGPRLCVLSFALAVAGGCGKKNAAPSTAPDEAATDSVSESDEAPEYDDSSDGADAEDVADSADATGADTDEQEAPESHQALVKLELKRNGKTIEHPGYMVERDEPITIIMTKGGHTHEVDFFYEVADSGYDVKITYRDNGRQVLEKSTNTEKQQWFKLKSGKTVLSVFLDPDAGRVDEVEMVGGDDPLGGM